MFHPDQAPKGEFVANRRFPSHSREKPTITKSFDEVLFDAGGVFVIVRLLAEAADLYRLPRDVEAAAILIDLNQPHHHLTKSAMRNRKHSANLTWLARTDSSWFRYIEIPFLRCAP